MKTRMQKLWDETVPLGGSAPNPNPDAVLHRVNAALDGNPRVHRPLKYAAILAAVLLLLAGTAIASEQGILPGYNVLHTFFHGDSDDYALSLVNAEQNSISDENYTMTVTSSIADERHAYFTLTIEPKTEKARYFLSGNGEEYFTLPLMFRHAWSDNFSGGMVCGPSPDNPDIFCAEISWDVNVGLWKTVYVRMDDMEEGLWLEIPVEPISPVKLNIGASGQGMGSDRCAVGGPVTLEKLELSPMTVTMYYTTPDDTPGDPLLYFLWKDGSLTTYGQMNAIGPSGNGSLEDDLWSFKHSWKFGHLQDIREMEAIVFENMAYPLDGGEPYEIDTSEIPRPFAVPAGEQLEGEGNPSIPVFAVCSGLGIPYDWDEETGTLTAAFRDVTMTVTTGSHTVLFDGADSETFDMYSSPVYQDGELWADIPLSSWHVARRYTSEKEWADAWLIIP